MKIAVEGCAHGELDKIYESIETLEKKSGIHIDLLIICGDFQAVRNLTDLESMAVPPKYRKLNTFYKYYSGEKKAPILTLFIGGNHEASNYMSELSYGGWVCPNIYYMGYANVVNIGGLRIAGLSGIYKGNDYLRGHFESPPYNMSTVKSVYHVRNVDVFRLKQIRRPIDICISHDWPKGIYNHGNMEQLLRFKPFFRGEMQSNKLGSQPAEELLAKLKPSYWFAAHLHCKFSAIVPHSDKDRPCTKFLALDKCLPKRRFLQILEIGGKPESIHLEYDPEWISILRNTNHLLNVSRTTSYMPGINGHERWDFTITDSELEDAKKLFKYNLEIPQNFCVTAERHLPGKMVPKKVHVKNYLNPQTQAFCKLLSLTDPNEAVSSTHSISISEFSGTTTDVSFSSVPSSNPDEICCSDEDEQDTTPQNDSDIIDSPDFFIDKIGSSRVSNKVQFLRNQFCSTPLNIEPVVSQQFPDIKEKVQSSTEPKEDSSSSIVFKRRNFALYSNSESESTSESSDKRLKC